MLLNDVPIKMGQDQAYRRLKGVVEADGSLEIAIRKEQGSHKPYVCRDGQLI